MTWLRVVGVMARTVGYERQRNVGEISPLRTICRLARDPCEGLPVKDRGGEFPPVTG